MIHERIGWQAIWQIEKYTDHQAFECGQAESVEIFEGNLLLNEGIAALLALLTGSAATTFSSSNAYLGVGSSSAAAVATQTGLQGASKAYKAMDVGYPGISNQTVTFRSIFSGSEANFAWQEVTVASGNSDDAVNLNRKVQSLGTKASPSVWALQLQITVG